MNNAEVENILLTLEPPLTWKPSRETPGEYAPTDGGYYSVILTSVQKESYRHEQGVPLYAVHFWPQSSPALLCPFTYEHVSDAKAACVRHLETGKWD